MRCDAKRHTQQGRLVSGMTRACNDGTPFPIYKYNIEQTRKEKRKEHSAKLRLTVRKCVFQREKKTKEQTISPPL